MVITLVLVLSLVLLLGACAKPAPAPAPTPAPAPAPAPKPKPTPAPAPKPAPAPAPKPEPKPLTPEEFYAQNTATIYVGFSAGGGTDFSARLIAAFWPDAMGGTARIKNMPGGGGLVATNYVWKQKPDGLTLEVSAFATVLAATHLFKKEGKEFDIDKFGYIGMYANEPYFLCLAKDSPYNSVADLQKAKGLKLGTPTTTGGPPLGMAIALHLLGLEDASIIPGYSGTPEMSLACVRGEIDGYVVQASTIKSEEGKGFVKGMFPVQNMRSSLYPDIAPLGEQLTLTPEQQKLIEIYTDAFKGSRCLFMSPGVSQDKIDYLRESFDKMMELKGFQRHAKARYQAFEKPFTGAETEVVIKKIVATPESDVAKLKELLDYYIK